VMTSCPLLNPNFDSRVKIVFLVQFVDD
jgi:hypothetical protein